MIRVRKKAVKGGFSIRSCVLEQGNSLTCRTEALQDQDWTKLVQAFGMMGLSFWFPCFHSTGVTQIKLSPYIQAKTTEIT